MTSSANDVVRVAYGLTLLLRSAIYSRYLPFPPSPELDVLPWPERKSRRGRPKTIDTSGHGSQPGSQALVGAGLAAVTGAGRDMA